MRVIINGEHYLTLTFFLHLIVIDWIWKVLEINFLGKENGNTPDSILLVLICGYITWILR
ncbi:hypothetical protein PCO09_00475 [Streptococcus suis]|uniref:hypothetical protein n=1 Tax=Streptococcus suis TaxID=1307 RepID=UPI0005D16D2D|nr:hypothetical protein [Streptococcus suis]MDN2966431.1 hypothetical protein [Streptococcus suis]MDN2983697.1 hypothetical protein [Streptococcus suis]MDN2985629.1 hypothetical protein [Streptococcus suis]MDS1367883.1 hypothetical protein [Streptococcus suis]CYZ52344.1 Uncharacterised protein [Streptococcus suis]